MSYYNLCGIGSQHSNISKGKGGGDPYKNHWYHGMQDCNQGRQITMWHWIYVLNKSVQAALSIY